MSNALDWSDPRKLQRRDGGEVIACGVNDKNDQPFAYWVTYRRGNRVCLSTHYADGRHLPAALSDADIIPRPREPRTVEGLMRSEVFGEIQEYSSWTFLPGRKLNISEIDFVRVRITEVIDE